jgi:hypothetical protein
MRLDVKTLILGLSLTFVLSACGESAPPNTAGTNNPNGAPSGAAGFSHGVVPIAFEAKKAGSKQFPFALVEGKVGDQPVRFILDTGAAVHVIDAQVATAAKIATPANATSISIDGWGVLPSHAALVRELPASIRTHGIGGVISPQLLADAGQAVVVDLVNQKLRSSPKSMAWSAMEDVGALLTPPAQRKLCAADVEGITGVAMAVDGAVDGEHAHLAIDTGASRSLFLEGSKVGARAQAHPVLGRTMAAGAAADVATSIYGGVPITAGAWSQTADVGLTPPNRPAPCGSEGRLGMDVLHDCALAMTADEFLVACRAPGR